MKGDNKIAVAMSGGVDSSLAAALLKREGRDVIGVTFKMWPREECASSIARSCCSLEAITRARAVADKLKIPYYVFDLSAEFKRDVIDYFCEGYLKATTPNPCILCNEKIKFLALMDKARSLGARTIATGHYANVSFERRSGRYILRQGADRIKDQSYFLFSLSQQQLASVAFPLGKITKKKAVTLAKRLKLKSCDAPSSQDVCFIRDLDYAEYIKKKTLARICPGDIVDSSGNVLGRHKGLAFYTIGQRRGLGVAFARPLYVTKIDALANRVIVGVKKEVFKKSLIADSPNWISISGIDKPLRVQAKIRYNHKKAKAVVSKCGGDSVRVDFERPQEAPTPGQAVVFYDRDVVLGGAWIREVKN